MLQVKYFRSDFRPTETQVRHDPTDSSRGKRSGGFGEFPEFFDALESSRVEFHYLDTVGIIDIQSEMSGLGIARYNRIRCDIEDVARDICTNRRIHTKTIVPSGIPFDISVKSPPRKIVIVRECIRVEYDSGGGCLKIIGITIEVESGEYSRRRKGNKSSRPIGESPRAFSDAIHWLE